MTASQADAPVRAKRLTNPAFWRGLLPDAIRAGLVGMVIGALFFGLFCLANRASLGRDVATARAHIAQAFADGVLQDQDYLDGNTDIGRHQYNDCLILRLAVDQRASPAQLTVSPLVQVPVPPRGECQTVHGFIDGEPPVGTVFYHRYIHGHAMLARYLLPVLSVAAIRNLYHTVLTLLVLAGIVTGLITLGRGRRPVQSLFWLIVFLAVSRWFGLETYGQSLGHAPADIVLIGYLLFLAVVGTTRGIGRRAALISAALFGALTISFEFLTGGIPLGLAAVIGGLPFAWSSRAEARGPVFPLAPLIGFCASIATVMLLKIALVLKVFGLASMREDALQLKMRMGMDATRGETRDLGLALMAKKLAKGINGLAPGMHVMAGAIVAIALLAGLWGARHLLRSADPVMRQRTLALLASNAAIALMLVGFWQHTMIHAWFMERTLVWTIATGFALFALACRDRAYRVPPGAGCDR